MRLLFLFLFCFSIANGQQSLTPGSVIPAIKWDESSSETYAIYLPREYNSAMEYPVVFVFEASGKGAKAVQKFTIAAELTGSIIVAPNKAVNDNLQTALLDSEAFINKIYASFAVDKSKIVLAGNDKGSLLACTSAHVTSDILGVIAINDAYMDLQLLRKKVRAKFVLLNGDEGDKYYKMNRLGLIFRNKESLVGFYNYEGDADIPEAGFLSAALTSIHLEAGVDSTKTKAFYENDMAFGDLLWKKQKYLSGYEFVNDLRSKYKKRIENLDGQKELLKKIRGAGAFKTQRSQRRSIREEEAILADDFQYYLEDDSKNSYFDNLGWWNFQMSDLELKIDSTASNAQERKSAIRLKKYVQQITEVKYQEISKQTPKIKQRLFINVLRTLINPINYDAFLNAISLSSLEGDSGAALFYLEELLSNGYNNYESLYTIEGTTALKIGEEYNEIVRAYFGKSKY